MAGYNYALGTGGNGSSSAISLSQNNAYGRVVDIILDENHPSYKKMGGAKSINGIFYHPFKAKIPDAPIEELSFAYQSTSHIKVIPTIGEIVKLDTQPGISLDLKSYHTHTYYTGILNPWNVPNMNPVIDEISSPELDISHKQNFPELAAINPIRSVTGDLQIEGRQGQSIRFTGAKGSANSFVDDSNINTPVILISNGQIDTKDSFTTISEDINKDANSIYLLSNHKVPLKAANQKEDSYKEPPTTTDQYKGNQVIINGGRVVFNAKSDSILQYAQKSIGISSGDSINLDSGKYFCVDSSKVYLGRSAKNEQEPVLLGNRTEHFLQELLSILEGISLDFSTAVTADGAAIPVINKRGSQMKPIISLLKGQINPDGPSRLKSKKVYTE